MPHQERLPDLVETRPPQYRLPLLVQSRRPGQLPRLPLQRIEVMLQLHNLLLVPVTARMASHAVRLVA